MSDFYGKRFLSSLVGALSVLSSPVASAKNDKLGKGNLKGKVGSSAGRGKNGGKLGELKSNRKVKGVKNLKKVLKETDGEVVGVSPDGKGGFVVFVKTPTGKVVALAIVSVPLAVIIYCLVCFGRKNGEGIGGSEKVSGGENNPKIVNEGNGGVNVDLPDWFSDQSKFESFIDSLFVKVFGDEFKGKFAEFERNFDEFLIWVVKISNFKSGSDYLSWGLEGECFKNKVVRFSQGMQVSMTFANDLDWKLGLFTFSVGGFVVGQKGELSFNARNCVSMLLFSFWCLAESGGSIEGSEGIGEWLKGEHNQMSAWDAIYEYVGYILKEAERRKEAEKADNA